MVDNWTVNCRLWSLNGSQAGARLYWFHELRAVERWRRVTCILMVKLRCKFEGKLGIQIQIQMQVWILSSTCAVGPSRVPIDTMGNRVAAWVGSVLKTRDLRSVQQVGTDVLLPKSLYPCAAHHFTIGRGTPQVKWGAQLEFSIQKGICSFSMLISKPSG